MLLEFLLFVYSKGTKKIGLLLYFTLFEDSLVGLNAGKHPEDFNRWLDKQKLYDKQEGNK